MHCAGLGLPGWPVTVSEENWRNSIGFLKQLRWSSSREAALCRPMPIGRPRFAFNECRMRLGQRQASAGRQALRAPAGVACRRISRGRRVPRNALKRNAPPAPPAPPSAAWDSPVLWLVRRVRATSVHLCVRTEKKGGSARCNRIGDTPFLRGCKADPPLLHANASSGRDGGRSLDPASLRPEVPRSLATATTTSRKSHRCVEFLVRNGRADTG